MPTLAVGMRQVIPHHHAHGKRGHGTQHSE